MNYPKVSIIILNWNNLNDILECLESVYKSDYPNYEVIVVDNASSDGSHDEIKKLFPRAALIKNNENMGYAGGNNIGIKYAMCGDAQYFWLLNNDTIVEPDTLANLVRAGQTSSQTGLLSPVIYYYYTRSKIQFCGSYFDMDNFKSVAFRDLFEAQKHGDKDVSLWGTALLIKRKVIEKVGFFNDNLFAYYEDTDFSLRSINIGFSNKIVLSAKIFHKSHFEDNGTRRNLPAYIYFYMSRNEYFCWFNNICGFERFRFIKKYLTSVIRRVGVLRDCCESEKMDATLIGFYCALRNMGGKWNNNIRVPSLVKKIILWHPYFIADLLDLELMSITKMFLKKPIT